MYVAFSFWSTFHIQAKSENGCEIVIQPRVRSHVPSKVTVFVSGTIDLFNVICVKSKGLHPTHFQTVRKTSTASVNEPSTCLFLEPSKAAIKISSLHISQLRLRLFLNSRQLYRSQRIQVTTTPFRTFDFKWGGTGPAKGLLLKNINILVIQLIALISVFGVGILYSTLADRYHKQEQNCRFIRTYGPYELIWPNLSK